MGDKKEDPARFSAIFRMFEMTSGPEMSERGVDTQKQPPPINKLRAKKSTAEICTMTDPTDDDDTSNYDIMTSSNDVACASSTLEQQTEEGEMDAGSYDQNPDYGRRVGYACEGGPAQEVFCGSRVKKGRVPDKERPQSNIRRGEPGASVNNTNSTGKGKTSHGKQTPCVGVPRAHQSQERFGANAKHRTSPSQGNEVYEDNESDEDGLPAPPDEEILRGKGLPTKHHEQQGGKGRSTNKEISQQPGGENAPSKNNQKRAKATECGTGDVGGRPDSDDWEDQSSGNMDEYSRGFHPKQPGSDSTKGTAQSTHKGSKSTSLGQTTGFDDDANQVYTNYEETPTKTADRIRNQTTKGDRHSQQCRGNVVDSDNCDSQASSHAGSRSRPRSGKDSSTNTEQTGEESSEFECQTDFPDQHSNDDCSESDKQGSLTSQFWFFDNVDRGSSEALLGSMIDEPGTYLVRNSKKGGESSPYTLSVVYKNHVYHLLIRQRPDVKFALGKEKSDEKIFSSVSDLVVFYQNNFVELIGDATKKTPSGRIQLRKCPPK